MRELMPASRLAGHPTGISFTYVFIFMRVAVGTCYFIRVRFPRLIAQPPADEPPVPSLRNKSPRK
jgi:hypothetical protein